MNQTFIGSRIARRSYGIQYSTRWNRLKHKKKDRYFDSVEYQWRARNQMDWFIKKVSLQIAGRRMVSNADIIKGR